MRIVRILLGIIGLLAAAMGLLWIGQGMGWVNWPQSSFMIDQRPWVLRGAIVAIVGLVLFWWSRRRA